MIVEAALLMEMIVEHLRHIGEVYYGMRDGFLAFFYFQDVAYSIVFNILCFLYQSSKMVQTLLYGGSGSIFRTLFLSICKGGNA